MSFKVEKLTITKGRTVEDKEANEWQRITYSLEMSIQNEKDIEMAKCSGEALLDMWLKGETITQQPSQKTASVELPGVDLSKLPWKSYKTKQDAKENEAGWIFSNTAGAEVLLTTLKSKDGKARVGTFDYQLQGKEKQFISRKPVK